jgi:hypothetical protein
MAPFILAGQACSAAGACVGATLSAPAWIGLVVVGGAVLVGSKLIDVKTSNSSSLEKSTNF